MTTVSVVVTSYNRPDYLASCLAGLEAQTRPPDEVVVADDGSSPEHLAAIEALLAACPLETQLATQEDRGFRLAASRNNAVRRARGELLVFTDGDVVFFPDVVERHLAACEGGRLWTSGYFLPLTPAETARLTPAHARDGQLEALWPGAGDPRPARLLELHRRFLAKSRLARWLPLESHLRKLPMRGGNSACPRAAFERVNGFDEAFEGWGCEDDDLALRLLLAGVWGRSVLDTARAVHQHHPLEATAKGEGDRPVSVNKPYHKRRRWRRYVCERGLRPR